MCRSEMGNFCRILGSHVCSLACGTFHFIISYWDIHCWGLPPWVTFLGWGDPCRSVFHVSADLSPPYAVFLGSLFPPSSCILFGVLKVLMGKRESPGWWVSFVECNWMGTWRVGGRGLHVPRGLVWGDQVSIHLDTLKERLGTQCLEDNPAFWGCFS